MNKTTKIISSSVAAIAAATGIYFVSQTDSQTTSTDIINWDEELGINLLLPEIPQVDIPSIELNIPSVDLNNTALADTEITEINVNTPDNYENELNKIKLLEIKLKTVFKDQRNINHDTKIFDNKFINEWINIYQTHNNMEFKQILDIKPFTMISEVKLPKNNDELNILNQNLKYYQSMGYDSVLITFDGSENPYNLKYLAQYIKRFGFRPFFAFGGNENLSETIFIDPLILKNCLINLAGECEGFLIGWRRTSVHLLEQDIEYMNYMISNIRNTNPDCLIFGELYYGNSAKYPEQNIWGFNSNIPKCSSAILINNFGYSSVDIKSVITKLIPTKIGKHNYIGLVVGQKPYYATTNKNNLSLEENRQIKRNIEKQFHDVGCIGTITLHDDGKNFSKIHNNNLSTTSFK